MKKVTTVRELRALFREAGVEYYIKKQKDGIIKVNILLEDEPNEA
jgi:hypothetical protein